MTNETEPEMPVEYQQTKEECQLRITGVCEGCGGKLEPIETVDNSDNATFWSGCKRCGRFSTGIDLRYWKVARTLVINGALIPYPWRKRPCKEDNEKLATWINDQCSGLSHEILRLHKLLKEEFGDNDTRNK